MATIACHTWGGNVSTDTGVPIIRFALRISLPRLSRKDTAAGRVSYKISSNDGIDKYITETYPSTPTHTNKNMLKNHTNKRRRQDGRTASFSGRFVSFLRDKFFPFVGYASTNNLRFASVYIYNLLGTNTNKRDGIK